jgi:Uma2 family endonuclease
VELMTFEELERLPEEPGKTELLDGKLIRCHAKRGHNKIAKRLFLRLFQLVEGLRASGAALGLGEVEIEMGYKIVSKPDSWLIPDVSVTHRSQPGEEYCEGAPLIAVEVISEFKMAAKIDRKIERYLANGGQEV